MDVSLLLHPINHSPCYLSRLRNKWYMLKQCVRKTSKFWMITSAWCFNSKSCVFILVQAENEEFQKKVMEDGSMKWFNLKSLPLTTQVCNCLVHSASKFSFQSHYMAFNLLRAPDAPPWWFRLVIYSCHLFNFQCNLWPTCRSFMRSIDFDRLLHCFRGMPPKTSNIKVKWETVCRIQNIRQVIALVGLGIYFVVYFVRLMDLI